MKKENGSTYTKRSLDENLSEINKIRQIANKNHAICKERERFFFVHQDNAPLSAQTGPFTPTDVKIPTEASNTLKTGYMAGLRQRFVFSVLLLSAVIISSRYGDGRYMDSLQKIQNLLTETMVF